MKTKIAIALVLVATVLSFTSCVEEEVKPADGYSIEEQPKEPTQREFGE